MRFRNGGEIGDRAVKYSTSAAMSATPRRRPRSH
jgi:hypothetical protein